nr:ABC transporter permease [Terrimesophilobacter mesophilus]
MRDHRASVLVAALSSAFGVLLLEVTGALSTLVTADDIGRHAAVSVSLTIVAFVFLTIAVYVGAIVTTNTFATIIAGRTKTIALLRLIGSSSRQERRAVATEGFVVGLIGSALGAVAGVAAAFGAVRTMVGTGLIPDLAYEFFPPVLLVPVSIVFLTTWLSAWIGSRRVLQVTPLEAVGASQELSRDESDSRRGRTVAAIVLSIIGIVILVLGVLLGLVSQLGVLVGVVGGILSFTGLVLGAHLFMPTALQLAGRLMGSSAEARLAAANAVRYPERSSRMTIGLVIGITLITMFAVATQTFQDMIHEAMRADPQMYQGVDGVLSVLVTVFSVLIGFSALIAAVGMVNNLSLSVLQRQRELGLLRALGFTGGQVKRMIVVESAQYSIAAVGVGLLLGIAYGWAGAQALLGSIHGSPGLVIPSVPWLLLVLVVAAAATLTAVASVSPARRATRIAPVVALAVDS